MITKRELKLVRRVAEAAIAAGREITLEIKDKDYKSKALNGGLMDSSTVEQRITLTVSEPMPSLADAFCSGDAEPEDDNDIL